VPDEQVQQQSELPLPFPELAGDMPLLPARMLNEFQYCPRLAYLEWVQSEWAESADTIESKRRRNRASAAVQGDPCIERSQGVAL
jgi:CRISP-associated protein Cas1